MSGRGSSHSSGSGGRSRRRKGERKRHRKLSEPAYVDLTGVFTAAKWRRTATKSLLKATNAVDQLCHTLVLIKHAFPNGDIATETRKLALTLATFERAIYWYAVRIRKFRTERTRRRRQQQLELQDEMREKARRGSLSPSKSSSGILETNNEHKEETHSSHSGGNELTKEPIKRENNNKNQDSSTGEDLSRLEVNHKKEMDTEEGKTEKENGKEKRRHHEGSKERSWDRDSVPTPELLLEDHWRQRSMHLGRAKDRVGSDAAPAGWKAAPGYPSWGNGPGAAALAASHPSSLLTPSAPLLGTTHSRASSTSSTILPKEGPPEAHTSCRPSAKAHESLQEKPPPPPARSCLGDMRGPPSSSSSVTGGKAGFLTTGGRHNSMAMNLRGLPPLRQRLGSTISNHTNSSNFSLSSGGHSGQTYVTTYSKQAMSPPSSIVSSVISQSSDTGRRYEHRGYPSQSQFQPFHLLPAPTAHPTASAYLAQNEHRIFKHAGGIVSLLKLLTLTLHQTRRLLGQLYQEHNSIRRWYWVRKTWLMGLLPPLILLRGPLRRGTLRLLELLALPFFPSLAPHLKQFGSSALVRWAFLALIPMAYQAIFYRSLYKKMRSLRILRSRLGILLRLWHLSISILDDQAEGRGDRARAGQAGRNLAQWMLEQCPPNLDSAFWYSLNSQLQLLKYGWDVLYCATYDWHSLTGTDSNWGLPIFLMMGPYYAIHRKWAAVKHSAIMGSPDITLVKQVWSIFESPIAIKLRELDPRMTDGKSGVAIREVEIRYGTSPPTTNNNTVTMSFNGDDISNGVDRLENLYTRSVRVTLISSEPLDIAINDRFSAPRRGGLQKQNSHHSLHVSVPVLVYFHGGGFISNFRTANMALLSTWAKATGFPILYIDYSLSPENAYPVALDECFDVYNWLCEGRLGLEPSKIIFVGESVGGNLATATVMRAISAKMRKPDSLILACPILNLGTEQTPSRSLFMMDAVLPLNLLNQCRSVYVPSNCDANSDPCLSPLVAHPHLLQQFPPTSIMVGELDPFLDDAVDMAHRLYYSAVSTKLKIYPMLPHAFFSFTPWLTRAATAVAQVSEWLKDLE